MRTPPDGTQRALSTRSGGTSAQSGVPGILAIVYLLIALLRRDKRRAACAHRGRQRKLRHRQKYPSSVRFPHGTRRAESAAVDPLQNIPASSIGRREESGVDMPAAVVFAGDRRPVQPEGAQNTHFFRMHGQCFLCVFPVFFSQSVGRWQSFCKNCAGFFKKAKPIHRKAAGAENKSLRGYPARIRQHPVYRLLRSIPGAAPNDHGLTIVPGPPESLRSSSRIFL